MVARFRSHGSAPATVRQTHRVFSLLLALAARDGRIPRNPADKVPLPRVTRGVPRFLSRDEVERLADAADGDSVRLLAYTGCVFGEMAGLRVRRVDFLRRRLTVAEAATEVAGRIEYGTPKTHQQRTPCRCRPSSSSRWRAAAWQDAGRPGDDRPSGSVHDLRHTAASLAVASGAHVKLVQRMLGHASTAMTLDADAALFDADLGALAERMDAATAAHAKQVAKRTTFPASLRPPRSRDEKLASRPGLHAAVWTQQGPERVGGPGAVSSSGSRTDQQY